jgi:hypothetical protein
MIVEPIEERKIQEESDSSGFSEDFSDSQSTKKK